MPLKKVNTVQQSLFTLVKRFIKFGIQGSYSNIIRYFLPIYGYCLVLILTIDIFWSDTKTKSKQVTNILSVVPQGSVLAPTLYTVYTSNLPQSNSTYTATYADDTVNLSCHRDKNTASQRLQLNLNDIDM